MRFLRSFLLVAFLAGLAALEISHGMLRLSTLRAGQRALGIEAFERDLAEVARPLAADLGELEADAALADLAGSLARVALPAGLSRSELRLATRDGVLLAGGRVEAHSAAELERLVAAPGPAFAGRVTIGEDLAIALPLGGSPLGGPAGSTGAAAPVWLVGQRSEALLGSLPPGETAWIVLSTVLVIVLLALASAFFLRLSARAFRLNETERYLRWIRRVTDKYRALMEGAADMILIVEPESGVVRESNAMARELLGLTDAEGRAADGPESTDAAGAAEHVTLDALFEGAHRAGLRAGLARAALSPGRPVEVPGLHARGEGGRDLAVDGRLALIDLGDERVVEVSLRDLTLQKEIERQLRIAERLSSMGLLTAGVAHEINNPLEGIGNYLSLLQRDDLDEARRRRYLEQVHHGFERIRDIVADLLRFARPGEQRGQADLGQVVERSVAMAAYAKIFREVEVERRGLAAPLPVTGDAGRLEQVVLNLLLNAATAMEGRGRIVMTGARTPGSGGQAAQVELHVDDEGPGIEPSQLDRLFDPFYSGHGGTGLGLSVSYGIVKAHAGTLTAANRERGGARFTIRLPAGAPAPTQPAPTPPASTGSAPSESKPTESKPTESKPTESKR
jgi:signal transduction histidine kinase